MRPGVAALATYIASLDAVFPYPAANLVGPSQLDLVEAIVPDPRLLGVVLKGEDGVALCEQAKEERCHVAPVPKTKTTTSRLEPKT